VPGKAEILAAAVSSAGKMAVAGCVDGMVYLYHLTSGKLVSCGKLMGSKLRLSLSGLCLLSYVRRVPQRVPECFEH
jgi:hypothetical protein